MEYILFWLGLSLVAGFIANSKGRSGIGFFLLSLLLSPLIGIVAALVVADGAVVAYTAEGTPDRDIKACPYCAETIKLAAVICKHCGRDLPAPAADDMPVKDTDTRALMAQYGITFEGEKYCYKQHRYADLRDAVRFAKKQAEKEAQAC